MSKSIFSLAIVAVVALATSDAWAADGMPNETTLSAMGLTGMQTLSDHDALSVRGKGYHPSPGASAYGQSWASVWDEMGEAGTDDGFYAFGNYAAGGDHFSEAGKEFVHTETVDVNGSVKTVTINEGFRVFAGGFANSMRL